MTSRPSTAAPILAVLAIVLAVMLGPYVGGYFWLGSRDERTSASLGQRGQPRKTITRLYPERWQAVAFGLAGRVEQWVSGNEVVIWHADLQWLTPPLIISEEEELSLELTSP